MSEGKGNIYAYRVRRQFADLSYVELFPIHCNDTVVSVCRFPFVDTILILPYHVPTSVKSCRSKGALTLYLHSARKTGGSQTNKSGNRVHCKRRYKRLVSNFSLLWDYQYEKARGRDKRIWASSFTRCIVGESLETNYRHSYTRTLLDNKGMSTDQ